MMLLEHDAKSLLAAYGINQPNGALVNLESDIPAFSLPWVVKAQVPVGGRGKAGGVAVAASDAEYKDHLQRLIGSEVRGHRVRHCRVEQTCIGDECYISLMLDAAKGRLVVLASQAGGVDIENHAIDGGMLQLETDFAPNAALTAINAITTALPPHIRIALKEAGAKLVEAFFTLELTLAEINPLFVRPDGGWTAADAKLVVDDNAIPRQEAILELIRNRADDYLDANVKVDHGFDFLRLDPDGEIGMLTTGAGLSMQLVDELKDIGCKPFNFCDIRTGQFRGRPDRMVRALQWMAEGKNVKVVLVNFFAGVTDLGELAPLILEALDQVPELQAGIVIRLVGNRLDDAIAIFTRSGKALRIEPDLSEALKQAQALTTTARPKLLEGFHA